MARPQSRTPDQPPHDMASSTNRKEPKTQREIKLGSQFLLFIKGKRKVVAVLDGKHFLEAACLQSSASACVEHIMSDKNGLSAIHDSLRRDLGKRYIQSYSAKFLLYISDPAVKALNNGVFLDRILHEIVEPRSFFDALVGYFKDGELDGPAVKAVAWLSLELLSLPTPLAQEVTDSIREIVINGGSLLTSKCQKTRSYGYKLEKLARLLGNAGTAGSLDNGPGGRHDNDREDFREVSIYPTRDELLYPGTPYFRLASEVAETPIEHRARAHLDNQFRLLREDMLGELRTDIQIALEKKKRGRRTATVLGQLSLVNINFQTRSNAGGRISVLLYCQQGLGGFPSLLEKKRKTFLSSNPGFLRHQSFGAFCCNKELLTFGFIYKDEKNLLLSPPVVEIQMPDVDALRKVLDPLLQNKPLSFALVDTPVFAYEPVLRRLKSIKELPLDGCLLNPSLADQVEFRRKASMENTITRLKDSLGKGGSKIGKHPVDDDQMRSIIDALSRPVSTIVGPPGTGKSYVGALIVSIVLQQGMKVLVMSYTNHSLDQFLMDLVNVEISSKHMVRLGSKPTEETAEMSLHNQSAAKRHRSATDWAAVRTLQDEIDDLKVEFDLAVRQLSHSITRTNVLEYLEFGDIQAYEALVLPDEALAGQGMNDFVTVGKKGRRMDAGYLYDKWQSMGSPHPFTDRISGETAQFWKMPRCERVARHQSWIYSIMEEKTEEVARLGAELSEKQKYIETLRTGPKRALVEEKKVIGCTTTAAAMYPELIAAAKADVVLIEEAGEILEAHILTALAPSVRQLVLIGDHKQLRPKINNYQLSVEVGSGYDLNRSLFERLILHGHPYSQLSQQHRMHPDISVLPRTLTYPSLKDGPRTPYQPEPLGVRGRVIFVNHEQPEESFDALADRRDNGANTSKQNTFEAEMVLRLVKYLGQQGYRTDKLVVLTPYLGQLRLLQEILSRENDPMLTDLDSHELRRAGLLTEAAAKVGKSKIRISTIDNYQGEETSIVVVSLTRSNSHGDIGFLSSPERVNVLLTRARQCVIMIGNMDTFLKSKKGGGVWMKLFNLLKEGGNLHDGIPVECQQHPGTTSLLRTPDDFLKFSPDGGCSEPCDAPLSCGLHICDRRCHQVRDHSKAPCTQLMEKTCKRGHRTRVICSESSRPCANCVKEDNDTKRRAQRDLKLELQRRTRQDAYEKERERIGDELDYERRLMKYQKEEYENLKKLQQEKAALKQARETRVRTEGQRKKQEEQAKRQNATQERLAREKENEDNNSAEGATWRPPETAEEEWAYLKKYEGEKSVTIDELMGMIGLETVKTQFLSTKNRVDTAIRQDISLTEERFSCCLLGNPGTGKTTIARLYGQFLTSVGVIPGSEFEETTGSKLANLGVQGCQDLLDTMQDEGGGVVFIDEAYQLTSENSPGGKGVLDFLLAEVENLTGKIVFVLAGYTKNMESFFAHNPGLPSRFPIQMKFDDYTNEELLRILKLKIENKFSGRMKVEGGLDGLFCRIVSRRLGRGRGREGFGNARDVENALVRICNRQADRLRKERRSGTAPPDDLLLTKEDVIGPEPRAALKDCKAWDKLKSLVGLQAVKAEVEVLFDSIQANYVRELAEEPPVEYTLNKVFLGSPGTGKTTVAKYYGQILVDLGILSNGEVVMKNPSDFVGAHLGESEKLTKGILASTIGKVLVIDEAYSLGSGSSKGSSDPYKTAVVDTIVAEVQSTPGEDRCVLLLGYKDQMEAMFENVNPGLSRRFPIASAFVFEDFTQEELGNILDLKLSQAGFKTTDQGRRVALEVLDRARNRPNFGNAGEVDIALNYAKGRHQKRLSTGSTKRRDMLEAVDFDENFNRAERSDTNIGLLFKDTVGCDKLVSILEGYQAQVRALKQLGLDPKDGAPFSFLFRGPPGTGKTSTARRMGKVFYDMGFLAKADVVECSASDLVAEYVGQTGPQVRKKFDNALGRVLFIDEAYRLAEGAFAKEAVDEMVDCLTKERYKGKMVVILAGYDDDINRLLSVNPGLSSRFPDVISFYSLTPVECIELLRNRLRKQKSGMEKTKATLDLSALEQMDPPFESHISETFNRLSLLKGWANARDVEALAKRIFGEVIKSGGGWSLVVTEEIVRGELRSMHEERKKRDDVKPGRRFEFPGQLIESPLSATITTKPAAAATLTSEAASAGKPAQPKMKPKPKSKDPSRATCLRDAGVSDEVWAQLQLDKQAALNREKHAETLKRNLASEASEALREKILDELIEDEKRRKKEAEQKKKLEMTGRCPAGYAWIRQEGGYRCAGGSHFVGIGELE